MAFITISPDWHWNGTLAQRAYTDYIVLHHAEASTCTARQVDEWHKSNGWSGIGYHFFVRKDGRIYRGRPLDKQGAHVSGMNNCSIGICAEGKYSTETMPDAQKKAICQLLVYLKDNYYPNAKIVGHKEIGSSDCPGRNYPLEDIKQNYRVYAGEEGLTVTQYEELKSEIDGLKPMIYDYMDDNMPAWAKPTIQKLMDKGIIVGDEYGRLSLTMDMIRIFVANDRAGLYD